MTGPIDVRRYGNCGTILFNRPEACNAITAEICTAVRAELDRFTEIDSLEAIMLGPKDPAHGFCSGCDLVVLRDHLGKGDLAKMRNLLQAETEMLLALQECGPTVTVMDGVTMGSGTCLAFSGHYRIATENTRFAVRECRLGLSPGPVTSWYLSRLPDGVGTLLAFTGIEIDAEDCLNLGIATHYIESERLAELRLRLSTRKEFVSDTLDEMDSKPSLKMHDSIPHDAGHFRIESVEEIERHLTSDPGTRLSGYRRLLRAAFPLALKVTLCQFAEAGLTRDAPGFFARVYGARSRLIEGEDFRRATTAFRNRAPDKPWRELNAFDQIDDAMVADMFLPVVGEKPWCPRSLFARGSHARLRPHPQRRTARS